MSTTTRRFQNRIVGYGDESPEQLLANPQNWRKHPGAQQNAMEGVLDEVGWVQNVIVNRVTGHMIDGHMRVQLAMRANEPTIPVTYVDLTPDEEALVLASFDPIGSLATRDADLLASLLGNIGTQDNDALQALLDAERSEATRLLAYDHTQSIVKGSEEHGRDQDDMMNDYLSTSVRQIVLIMNPETYAEALEIIQRVMKTSRLDTTTEAVLSVLRGWDAKPTSVTWSATHDDGFFRAASTEDAVADQEVVDVQRLQGATAE